MKTKTAQKKKNLWVHLTYGIKITKDKKFQKATVGKLCMKKKIFMGAITRDVRITKNVKNIYL